MIRLGRNDARIVGWMCDVKSEDRISTEELRTRPKLKSMRECLQDRRLQWFGHLETLEENAWSNNLKNRHENKYDDEYCQKVEYALRVFT